MKKCICLFFMCCLVLSIASCSKQNTDTKPDVAGLVEDTSDADTIEKEYSETADISDETDSEMQGEYIMKLTANGIEVPVIWDDNATVKEIASQAKKGTITIEMSMYGGWEQVGSLGRSYTRNDRKITAENGDIVLYSGNQIVLFYGENEWAYTHLGKINLDADEITNLLSNGDITISLSAE